jgi:hypothetical protein
MPSLLSGSALRTGGSQTYIKLSTAQPQLPPSPTTSTGYTIITDSKLVTSYASSLGNIQFTSGTIYSNLPDQNINIIGTDSSVVIVSGGTPNFSTNTGALQVIGGIGISDGLYAGSDIHVNDLVIGQGYEGQNNIIIEGIASPQLNEGRNGQNSIAIGYNTLHEINSALNSIAIGRYALSSGSYLAYNIAMGDSALKELGTEQAKFLATITNVVNSTPVVVTSPSHGVTTGTEIVVIDVIGTQEVNFNESINNSYFVDVLDSDNLALYSDVDLFNAVIGTYFSPYVSDGYIAYHILSDNNIAIGNLAATNFTNGTQNLFLGDNNSVNFTTGSYNIFIGHDVANNMTRGTANISIGGDNLVEGLDNQINIGSVFYYNGGGYLQLNADTGVGLGTNSTGTDNGAFVVLGGAGISDNLYVGGDVVIKNGLDVSAGNHDVNLSPKGGNVVITPETGGTVTIQPTTTVGTMDNMIIGLTTATRQNSYFLDVYANNFIGLATTATNLYGGETGGIPYQTLAGQTNFIGIGSTNTVLISNGTTATWSNIGALTAGTSTDANNVFINDIVPSNEYYLNLSTVTNQYGMIDADVALTYVTTVDSTSTYFITGTNTLNVPGSIYSMEGGENESNLLYTPRVVVGPTPPDVPRVGDFWIDTAANAQYQYIQDGTNRIWLQIAII